MIKFDSRMQPRLQIHFWGRQWHSFHFFGVIGFILATLLGLFLAWLTGRSAGVILLMSGSGLLSFLGLAYLWKILSGNENLVYYQHEISILIFCTVVLFIIGRPILPYLDITIQGIGLFLVFGRFGCFSVGCCHGKPYKTGVSYSKQHAKTGFPNYLVGVNLFPSQLVESFLVLVIVFGGIAILFRDFPAGTVIIWHTVCYGFARFILEYFRGDPERPYWKGFSEAQWTSFALIEFSMIAAYFGLLPQYGQHIAAGLILTLYMIGSPFLHKLLLGRNVNQAFTPRHLHELLTMLDETTNDHNGHAEDGEASNVRVFNSSQGVSISLGKSTLPGQDVYFYTVSFNFPKSFTGTDKGVENVALFLREVRHQQTRLEIIKRSNNIYHLVYTKFFNKDTPTN